MVKWTKIVLGHTKTYKRPKSSSQVLFELDIFHDDLYCCVKYSNVEYQVEIFKNCH